MKKLIAIAALSCGLFSCYNSSIPGSGNIISEKREISGFTGVSASASVQVEVSQGTSYSVVAEADDNLIKYLKTKVENGKLKVYIGDNVSVGNGTFRVRVTAPEINFLKASSSSSIEIVGLIKSGTGITCEASSSATISGEVDAPSVKADGSSSATITLSGRTKNFEAESSSSADIKAFDLLSENTEARASSSGKADVFASVFLKAKASSSGDINYKGNPATVDPNKNSSGEINKAD